MKKLYAFTLIELLVVLFVVSIIATAAVIAVGNGLRERKLAIVAEEIQLVMSYAIDEAVLQTTLMGFVLRENGFEFYRYNPPANNTDKADWQALKRDPILGYRKLPDFVDLTLYIEKRFIAPTSKTQNVLPKLIINDNGTITPFYMSIGEKNKNPRYGLQGSSNGTIKIISEDNSKEL